MSKTRPPLVYISPIVYFSCWSFIILNVFFFAPTFFLGGSRGLALVGLINPKIWAVLFLIMGVSMMIALFTNNWKSIKVVLFLSLAVKSAFAWALVFTLFVNIINIGIVGIWFALMTWQALCIIFFTPRVKNGND